MVTFIKDWDINFIIWNCILVRKNKKSMHDIELFITWVGLSFICLYPVDNVRESISWPIELVISFCNDLEWRAFKSSMTTEHKGN